MYYVAFGYTVYGALYPYDHIGTVRPTVHFQDIKKALGLGGLIR